MVMTSKRTFITDNHPNLQKLDAYLEVIFTHGQYKGRIRYKSGGASMTISVGTSFFAAALLGMLRLDEL